jgi:hypothetical protein
VVRATRWGENIGDARFAPAVIDYSRGLHEAYKSARPYRWVLWSLAALSLVLAVLDTYSGPTRLAIVSWIWVVFFAVEMTWRPRKQARLLANAERAHKFAQQHLGQHAAEEQ